MRSGANPYNNEAGLIDKYIGTAYEHVKTVAGALTEIKHLSENMQTIYDFAATKDAFEAFTQNPDFLQWLIDNEENFEDLVELMTTALEGYASLSGSNFTGFVSLGENSTPIKQLYLTNTTPVIGSTEIWEHKLNPVKIIGIQGTVHKLNGEIEAIGSTTNDLIRLWCDAEYIRMFIGETATQYGNRPFHVILTYIE